MSDPEDLEDGEIEDDEDDAPTEDPPLVQPTPADYMEHEVKHTEHHHHHHHPQASDDEAKPIGQSNTRETHAPSNHHHHANKSQRASNKPAPVVDDWATKVENAIANALKKDGVQPPMPSSVPHAHDAAEGDQPHASSGGRKSKKRKKANRGGGGGGGDGPQHHSKQPRLGEPDGDDGEMMDLEYEMLNVRGSSPQGMMGGRGDSGHSDGSDGEDDTQHGYSSDDSALRDRDGHPQRGGRREQRERDRERERERERERDRDNRNRNKRKPSRQRGNNNKAGRDGRKRKRDDSDDEKHRPTGPRKMELCKFYLMDCCAKREKCLYMHKDFPCKYYYLGMKCKEKEKCLFSHGEPLSDDLRAILLKHLETAPQEILGSFQRIGRDIAVGMLNATHRKLQERYGMKPDPPGGRIPSLLDVATHSPKHSRKSRWCHERQNDDRGRMSDDEPTVESVVGDMVMQLAGIITPAQISDLEQMGIRTLDEISQLTVAQLNELGLSITQIHDLQVRAMNALKQANLASERRRAAGAEMMAKDLDMRMMPPGMMESSSQSNTNYNEQQPIGGTGVGGSTKDVDMRVLPPAGEPEKPPPNTTNTEEVLPGSMLVKPPTVDYSQYIKDSNLDEEDLDAVAADSSCLLNDDPDEDDDDDDENHLKISIEDEEEEEEGKKESDENEMEAAKKKEAEEERKPSPLPPLVPPKIDYAQGLGDILMFGSSTIEKTLLQPSGSDSPSHRPHRSPSPATKDEHSGAGALSGLTDVWTPSMADSQTSSAQSYATQQPKPSAKANPTTSKRPSGGTSIYDWDDSDAAVTSPDGGRDSPVRTPFRYGSDRALPLDIGEDDPYSVTGSSISGAREASSELGFPFKSIMANYVPATEIDGSIGSHVPIMYKVYVVDVPRPNFGPLRRSMARPVGTKDPRLRRLFGLLSDDEIDADDASDGIKSPDPNPVASPLYGNPPTVHPPPAVTSKPAISTGPRIDPRKRHAEKQQLEAVAQQQQVAVSSNPRPSNVTPQIDVQAILQKSPWYKDLGSKHKIMVNQQLAILSTEMKKYHNSERTTEQLSEFMKFLGTNSLLQHILTCLNVFVDDSVTFCEVPVVPNLPPPALPMLPNIPPPSMGGPALPPAAMQLPVPVHVPPPLGPMSLPPPHQPNVPPMFHGGGPNGDPFGRQHDQQQAPPQGPPIPAMMRPGLLGVSPNMPFEQFLAMGNVNKNADGGAGLAGNNGPLPPWIQGNGNNMRNMRNNNRVGHNFRNNNDRWNNNGGGPPMGGNNNGNNGGNNRRNNNNNNNNRRMDRKK
uniref:C3H1-type domain-containing protein n=1 Tax=Anopheles dirus TaxID=7168 RepID=A0A182N283_9DIPT